MPVDPDLGDWYDIDEDAEYEPLWLGAPRGFVDFKEIEAERFNQLLDDHLHNAVRLWDCNENGWTIELKDLSIHVDNDIMSTTVRVTSETIKRTLLDPLREQLRTIRDLQLFAPVWSPLEFAVFLLQITEEVLATLAQWRKPVPRAAVLRRSEDGWDASAVTNWSEIYANKLGVNLATVRDEAQDILGQSVADICELVPDTLRILHVEPVIRSDLRERFLAKQQDLRDELEKLPTTELEKCVPGRQVRRARDYRGALLDYLTQPSVTFHGAPRRVISSIVRYGFIMPGEKIGDSGEKLAIRCGASFGIGIYSSPSPVFASYYMTSEGEDYYTPQTATDPSKIPGMRLIISAVLMGRPLQVKRSQARQTEGVQDKRANSHISGDGMQYVVFDSAQMLPCYVLHLDYGADEARRQFEKMPKFARDFRRVARDWRKPTRFDTGPGAVQARKQALKAAAAKWFPYGYGPATGTSFVVEEIGEVSDDEEIYGDFQAMRRGNEWDDDFDDDDNGGRKGEGVSWFDEYQTVRNSNRRLRSDG